VSFRLVRGVGPRPCRLMAVGEAPGASEDRRGIPFCGRSGEVLDVYLHAASLSRSSIFLTNLYPYWPGEGNPDPTPKQIREQEKYLVADLADVRPKFILAIGRLAARWFLGRIDLETAHGLPHIWPHSGGIIVVPAYHPAAGLHSPEMAAKSAYDVLQFGLVTRLEIPYRPRIDEHPEPDYALTRDRPR